MVSGPNPCCACSMIMASLGMYLWATQPWGPYAGKCRIVQYYAHTFAVLDKIFGSVQGW